ncbi:MAG TPA: hypothetical protein PKU91_01410 [Phycisphaerales bacterium]|nr:hypothetical protein [Phycisphaerales bacterium]
MIFEFDPALRNLVGATPHRLFFLRSGSKYLETLRSKVGDDDSILRETAAVHQRLGEMMADMFEKRIGGTDEGLEHLEQARRIRERLASRQPDDPLAKADLARSIKSTASAMRLEQQAEQAREEFDRAMRLFNESLAALPPDSEHRPGIEADRADCLVGIASCLGRLTLLAPDADTAASLQQESEDRYAAAESFWSERRRADPDDPRAARQAFLARDGLIEHLVSSVAPRYRQEKKYDQALSVLDRVDRLADDAIARLNAAVKDRPQDRTLRRNLEVAHHWRGWSLQERADSLARRARDENQPPPDEHAGILRQAGEHFALAHEIAVALEASDIDDLEAKRDLATIHNKLGNIEREFGRADTQRLAAARLLFEQSLAVRRDLAVTDPITRHTGDLVVGLTKLANVEMEFARLEQDPNESRARFASARSLYQEALQNVRTLIELNVRPANWSVVQQIESQIRACDEQLGGEAEQGR